MMATFGASVTLASASSGNTWVTGVTLFIREATGEEVIDFMNDVVYSSNMLTNESIMELVRKVVGDSGGTDAGAL